MKTIHAEAAIRVISGIARKADFETLGLDNVRAIKSDREHPLYRAQALPVVKDASDPEERTFTWSGSSEALDSMGDVIFVSGWNVARVKAGMAHLLMCHDSYPLPAGLLTKANKNGKLDDGTRALDLTGRFFELEVYSNSEFGKHVEGARKLTARNDLKGSSVGFIPLEGGFRWPEEKEREQYGMPPWGAIYDGQELLELSITAIPANRTAARRKDLRAALKHLVAAGEIEQDTAAYLEDDMAASDERWMGRVQSIGRTVVPLSRAVPWMRGKDAPPATERIEGEVDPLVPAAVAEAVARIEKAGLDMLANVSRELRLAARRDVFAGIREIVEPAEDAITEAADRIEEAVTQLGLGRKDSERAEVSSEVAPNGAPATSAASTGTSRDIPTTQAVSRAGELLLTAIDPTYVGADRSHADSGARS